MLVAVVAAVSLVPRAVAEEKPAVTQSKEVGRKTKELPKELTVDLGKGIKLEMVLIPAGEFLMGSPELDKDAFLSEKPQHRVRITKPFYLGKFLVTQEQWEAVTGSNPSKFKGPKNPVETVSWDDCQQFLGKLNAKSAAGVGNFQLPSEAQWEYACRAGSKTRYCFGDDESKLGEYAWYDKNSGNTTRPVGEKKPNGWGLYDMHGNVWEWCQDGWDGYYKESPVDDPSGPTGGSGRVGRGGSWYFPARRCRSADRFGLRPGSRSYNLGLRVSGVPAEAITTTYSPSANDQSGKTSSAKPADEVPPASDQSATKEGTKTESKPAPTHPLTAEQTTEEERVIAIIEKLGGRVTRDEKSLGKPVIVVNLSGTKVTDAELANLKGLTELRHLNLGETRVTDTGLVNIKGLTELISVHLYKTYITDAGLANFKGLTKLKLLELWGIPVTDSGLRHLEGLTGLESLIIGGPKITDAGLVHVKGLTKLRTLYLVNTRVTDTGLDDLNGLTQLKLLMLRGTQVTDEGVKKFQHVLPNCMIDRSYDPDQKPVSLDQSRLTNAQVELVKAARIQIDVLMNGLQAYQLDMGEFPTTQQGLKALRIRPPGLAKPERWSGPYLSKDVPLDPWQRPYAYRYPGKHNNPFVPDIWSHGPDGIDGTADDIGSWMKK